MENKIIISIIIAVILVTTISLTFGLTDIIPCNASGSITFGDGSYTSTIFFNTKEDKITETPMYIQIKANDGGYIRILKSRIRNISYAKNV